MSLKKTRIIIPARRNSKGLPFKNRKLIDFTMEKIPKEFKKNILIATDDEYIIDKYRYYDIFLRSKESSLDTASTKFLINEISEKVKAETFVMLYLTYPERNWDMIEKAYNFFILNNAKSLLCKKRVYTSPYLMMFDRGLRGEQVIKHNLYRRQDYPDCFEISHFISIFKTKEIDKLNNNMYNEDTIFYPIENYIDIDAHKDLEKFNEKNKNNC